MASASSKAAGVKRPPARSLPTAVPTPQATDAATAAWVSTIPCAVVAIAVIVLIGPPLGRLLSPISGAFSFLPESAAGTHPEPTEHARYLLALGVPLLLALAIARARTWESHLPARAPPIAVPLAQILTVIVLIACIVAQYQMQYGTIYTRVVGGVLRERYFNPATLIVSALIAIALLFATRSAGVRRRSALWLQESPRRRGLVLALAAVTTAIWMLHAVNSDQSIASALQPIRYHLEFTLDEAYAVLNGLTPLVNFSAQYSSLWPFVSALALLGAGKTLLVFTITMCIITALALLAIYGVLRRITQSSATAFLLYLPFLATSLFAIGEASVNRGTFANYFGIFPLRYAGPYFVAWLTARHLERRGQRVSAWLLFVAAGVTLLNNADFGVAAVGASVAALVWASIELRRRSILSLAGIVAAGLVTAYALVSVLTLVRAGSLPQLGRVVDYARLYAVGGYSMMPIPNVLGLHLAIYLTYVATIAVATVRALRRAPSRVLTGMLAWTGVFGLGSASYYVGRSHPEALRTTFSVWALALTLLTYITVRHLVAHPLRRPTIAAVTVLFGFGIAVCSIVQMPLPWSQLDRIDAAFVPSDASPYARPLVPPADAKSRAFVGSLAQGRSRFVLRPRAPVAILIRTGHHIADAYGIANVSPYTGAESLHTVQQVDEVIAALRSAGGNTVVLPTRLDTGILEVLRRRGFELLTHSGLRPYDPIRGIADALTLPWFGESVMKWVDTHHLHPRALRNE